MICPNCRYSLDSSDKQADSREDCPECGVYLKDFIALKIEKERKTLQREESVVGFESFEEEQRTNVIKSSNNTERILAIGISVGSLVGSMVNNYMVKTLAIMFTILLASVFMLKACMDSSPSSDYSYNSSSKKVWYEDGNLHKKNLAQWKDATNQNKLASSADMALASKKIMKEFKNSDSDDILLPYAYALVRCIDETSAGQDSASMKVSDVAVMCIITLGWE